MPGLVRKLPVPLLHAALLLVFVPGLPLPFSLPKLVVLITGAALFGLQAIRAGRSPPRWPALLACAWLALLSLSALLDPAPAVRAVLLDGAAAVLLLALLSRRDLDEDFLCDALAALGCVLAVVVLAQASAPGARLRLFGTLGNADFCAGWLGASACLAAARRRFWLLAPQLGALAALGSFATILALLAGAATAAAVLRPSARALHARPLLLAALACAALLPFALRRAPLPVVRGRLALHRIALPHLREAPLLGHGPGSVERLWPAWSAAWLSRQPPDDPRDAAPQDHVHDDWLERALEQGLPAALALAALTALAVARSVKLRQHAGPAAALASLAARAWVDFPLERPAELGLFVTLVAVCLRSSPCTESR